GAKFRNVPTTSLNDRYILAESRGYQQQRECQTCPINSPHLSLRSFKEKAPTLPLLGPVRGMQRGLAFKINSLNVFDDGFATAFTAAKRGVANAQPRSYFETKHALPALQGATATQASYLAISCWSRRSFNTNNFVFCAAVGTFERHG